METVIQTTDPSDPEPEGHLVIELEWHIVYYI